MTTQISRKRYTRYKEIRLEDLPKDTPTDITLLLSQVSMIYRIVVFPYQVDAHM